MSGEINGGRKHPGRWRVPAALGSAGRPRTARRRAGLLGAVTVAAAVALVPSAGRAGSGPAQALRTGAAVTRSAPAVTGNFVTLLFSRTEISAADGCVENDNSIARLDTTVAPYMQSLGMKGTGTLVTDRTYATKRFCTHYQDDLTASWADATNLSQNYGWKFVSHTATYPTVQQIENFTPEQAYHQTCGTIDTLKSHGLSGAAGMIAYPGSWTGSTAVLNLQTQYSQYCFDWGRKSNVNSKRGITDPSAATTPPYWQYTSGIVGGNCNNSALPCYNLGSNTRYSLPSNIIRRIQNLQPGQWLTLQAYILVTGKNPAYTQDRMRWDCTSPDPADHWTNVTVRYCWSDYQQILQAIANDPSITVTDPLTVGQAWGRPYS